jgi:large subunit ribosomal protein L17
MRHLKSVRKFNRDQEHRKAMFSNMMTSFFEHERITTTLAKAKELRRLSEKAITRAKENSLHNKRMIMRRIHDRDIIAKLFDEIAPKFKEVNGGYTRILKLGNRAGDGADLARIELIDPGEGASRKKKVRGTAKQAAPKKASTKEAPAKPAAKPKAAKPKAATRAAAKKETAKKATTETAERPPEADQGRQSEHDSQGGPASNGDANPSETQT